MSKQNSNLFPMPPKLPAFPVQPERDNRGKELDDLDELDAQATGEELTPDIEAEEPEAESASGTEEPQSTPVIPKPIRVPIRVPIMPALGRTGEVLWGQTEQAPEKPKSDMDDLFEVPQPEDNDMAIDDLFEVDDEDDFDDLTDIPDDLFSVDKEDIMGKKPIPR